MQSDIFVKPLHSTSVFNTFRFILRLIGINNIHKRNVFNVVVDLLVNVFITIWYPTHLTLGLLMLSRQEEIYRNLSMTITTIVCSLKHYSLRWKLKQMNEVEQLLRELDERASNPQDREYFHKNVQRNANFILNLFFMMYMAANTTAFCSVLLESKRRLMYPAWFPFDWSSSTYLYWLALTYQFVGISVQIMQNLVNDPISSICYCLLSGHVRLLSMRVARIGYESNKIPQQHENELKACIKDHLKLLRLFKLVEDSLSLVQLIQFVQGGLNYCVVIVYLVFYADNLFRYIYYSIFFVAMIVQLFPCYYYGTVVQQEFEQLPYAIFSSNWPRLSRSYFKNALIFGEVSFRKRTMLAGGIVSLRLETFFAICKMTYSLFTIARRIK